MRRSGNRSRNQTGNQWLTSELLPFCGGSVTISRLHRPAATSASRRLRRSKWSGHCHAPSVSLFAMAAGVQRQATGKSVCKVEGFTVRQEFLDVVGDVVGVGHVG